eukprot:365145-Chlamydomonas_euryale.AAC.28
MQAGRLEAMRSVGAMSRCKNGSSCGPGSWDGSGRRPASLGGSVQGRSGPFPCCRSARTLADHLDIDALAVEAAKHALQDFARAVDIAHEGATRGRNQAKQGTKHVTVAAARAQAAARCKRVCLQRWHQCVQGQAQGTGSCQGVVLWRMCQRGCVGEVVSGVRVREDVSGSLCPGGCVRETVSGRLCPGNCVGEVVSGGRVRKDVSGSLCRGGCVREVVSGRLFQGNCVGAIVSGWL